MTDAARCSVLGGKLLAGLGTVAIGVTARAVARATLAGAQETKVALWRRRCLRSRSILRCSTFGTVAAI